MILLRVLCFHMDLIKMFGTNPGIVDEMWTGIDETQRIKKDIIEQIEKDNEKFIYSHEVQIKLISQYHSRQISIHFVHRIFQ